jgi:hypothetical protein
MRVLKSIAIIFGFALVCIALLPAARAGQWSERTELQFNQPVEVPGVVLPAGTYWFVLSSDQSNRNIVEILDAEQSKVYATLMTVPTERKHSTGRTEVVLVTRNQSPDALWKWYYPGRSTGHAFMYPTHEEKQLSRDAKKVLFGEPMSSTANGSAAGA